MSNYFICNNEYLANGINYMTNIKYYKFTNNEGKEIYTFPRDKKIFEAYKIIMDFKNNN